MARGNEPRILPPTLRNRAIASKWTVKLDIDLEIRDNSENTFLETRSVTRDTFFTHLRHITVQNVLTN